MDIAAVFRKSRQDSQVAEHKNLIAIDRWCAAWSAAPAVVVVVVLAWVRELALPNLFACVDVDAHRNATTITFAKCEQFSVDDADGAESGAGVREFPKLLGTIPGPLLQQFLFSRFAISVGAAPLRPVCVLSKRNVGQQ